MASASTEACDCRDSLCRETLPPTKPESLFDALEWELVRETIEVGRDDVVARISGWWAYCDATDALFEPDI